MSTIVYTIFKKFFTPRLFVISGGFLIVNFIFWGSVLLVQAQMTSANYTIFADSINFAGGRGTSTSYALEDTLGEISFDSAGSANYKARAGYQAMAAEPIFSFTLSSNTINLGTLSEAAVSTASLTVTTTTNAPNGYTTSIYEDGDLRIISDNIDDVSDGSVSAGSEEYGISTSGAQGLYNGTDTAITNGKNIALYSAPINSSATVVTFKASRSGSTNGGSYAHTVTFISTGNF